MPSTQKSFWQKIPVWAQHQWKWHFFGIKNEILQGQTMNSKVYIKPQREAKYNRIHWLNKSIHALRDISLYSENKVQSVMIENNSIMSKIDPTRIQVHVWWGVVSIICWKQHVEPSSCSHLTFSSIFFLKTKWWSHTIKLI